MRRNQGNPNMLLILVIVVFLTLFGFGGSILRGASWGIGREAAHSMFRR